MNAPAAAPAAETRRAVLLLNLGTPAAPDPPEVAAYLKEFLSDPYVVDIPAIARWLLLHAVILPRRPEIAAAAYRKIWTPRGSPLLVHLQDLATRVRERLAPLGWHVEPAMRYGEPSVRSAIERVAQAFPGGGGCRELVVFPLYPQYSLAATESSLVCARRLAAELLRGVPLREVPAFFDSPAFLDSFAGAGSRVPEVASADHVLFSFHGLPERQIRKAGPTGGEYCLRSATCCDSPPDIVRSRCYRAQCFATARGIASRLALDPAKYSVSFQSRLGRTPWIRPFTDHRYRELADAGVRRIAVFSPAFVADCLETLEELQIRGRDDFRRCGGEELTLVPSLNSNDDWVKTVSHMVDKDCQR